MKFVWYTRHFTKRICSLQFCFDYGFLLSNVKDYISYLSKLMELNCFNLDMKLTISQGQAKRVSLNNFERNELAENNTYNGEKIFSYAFIFASIKPQHFSYTIM